MDRQQVFQEAGKNDYSGLSPIRSNRCYRYEGLVKYIASHYVTVAEIGIGHFPDVAFALLERGVKVFATDIRPFQYLGLRVIRDDITNPVISLYGSTELLYFLKPPPELIPYMIQLARTLVADLIVKPLASEYPGGHLKLRGNTTFFLWND